MGSWLFLSSTLFTLSGNPAPLVIKSALPGEEPTAAVNASTSYSLFIPEGRSISIMAALDSPAPSHTEITLQLESPAKLPPIPLLQSPQIVATRFTNTHYENLQITYTYKASVKAGVLPFQSRTVIFTILD